MLGLASFHDPISVMSVYAKLQRPCYSSGISARLKANPRIYPFSIGFALFHLALAVPSFSNSVCKCAIHARIILRLKSSFPGPALVLLLQSQSISISFADCSCTFSSKEWSNLLKEFNFFSGRKKYSRAKLSLSSLRFLLRLLTLAIFRQWCHWSAIWNGIVPFFSNESEVASFGHVNLTLWSRLKTAWTCWIRPAICVLHTVMYSEIFRK